MCVKTTTVVCAFGTEVSSFFHVLDFVVLRVKFHVAIQRPSIKFESEIIFGKDGRAHSGVRYTCIKNTIYTSSFLSWLIIRHNSSGPIHLSGLFTCFVADSFCNISPSS